ncbi:hypothetical protein ACFQFC_11770 [Amorphoplanes digitatis]|uniref:Lipoprotein n=1 Tax=Actinoplanes digitatis TaxID=1868 RepID=A0A7W7I1X8_9ACTN|nr:hypothetical protein [Actinoplanes digitatis]MBB4764882.1 hypothetical protein [Actinoplanes digitatis]BFE74478.1 hypothetical protein GCM10020092_077790 [Actinoplanes digitatis]GID91162.1 hypothetical protein Adi01nite_05740 [Actinoplanes digitatis]
MRTIPLAGTILCVALATGCTSSVPHVDGTVSPNPTVSAAPSVPAPATSTPVSFAPVTSKAPAVIGPFGVGALKLGMTREQAEATGLTAGWTATNTGCSHPTHLLGATGENAGNDGLVYYSKNRGIEIIDAHPGLSTPEGIRIGSTFKAMRKAYPSWKDVTGADQDGSVGSGRGAVPVPGNPKAVYRIVVSKSMVVELTLQYHDQACYE